MSQISLLAGRRGQPVRGRRQRREADDFFFSQKIPFQSGLSLVVNSIRMVSEDDDTSSSESSAPASFRKRRSVSNRTGVPAAKQCCLICSVLPALATVNCCQTHLAQLTKTFPFPARLVYLAPRAVNHQCKSHEDTRSYCSTSSSSTIDVSPRRQRKIRRGQLLVGTRLPRKSEGMP